MEICVSEQNTLSVPVIVKGKVLEIRACASCDISASRQR